MSFSFLLREMSICILDCNCVLITVAVLERYSDGILFFTILFPESGAEFDLFTGWDDGPVNGICTVVFALEVSYIVAKSKFTIFIFVMYVTDLHIISKEYFSIHIS